MFAAIAWLCLVSSPAHAQVTSLTMTSDPADYVGAGQSYSYSAADGSFTAQANFDGGVSIGFNTPNFGDWWFLDFAAPFGMPLTPGTYPLATRFPFQDVASPGLAVFGNGRGCNTLTGSFTVNQIVYGSDTSISAFDATFEQHCEGAAPALRGHIRYNAQVPLYLNAPARLRVSQGESLEFLVTAVDEQSRRVTLSAPMLPPGASFVDRGDNTGLFSWTPSLLQSGAYVATFVGDNGAGNQASMSTSIDVVPPPPPNDDPIAATPVGALPHTTVQDVTAATRSPDDVVCGGHGQSVWFSYTPTSAMRLEANTFGSNFDTALGVYTGSPGALVPLGCNGDSVGSLQSRVRFDAVPGTTYYFMAGSQFTDAPQANLQFNLQPAPPPLAIAASVEQFGSVVARTGMVTVRGTVRCTIPTFVTIFGSLRQMHAGLPLTSPWFASVPCDGITPWSAEVDPAPFAVKGRALVLFGGGKAEVQGTAIAFDVDNGEVRMQNFSAGLILRGR